MRIILAHAYHHVEQDMVGAVVVRDIPELHHQLGELLAHFDAGE